MLSHFNDSKLKQKMVILPDDMDNDSRRCGRGSKSGGPFAAFRFCAGPVGVSFDAGARWFGCGDLGFVCCGDFGTLGLVCCGDFFDFGFGGGGGGGACAIERCFFNRGSRSGDGDTDGDADEEYDDDDDDGE